MTTNYLSSSITLPSGVIVGLEVVSIPKPDTDGCYEPRHDYNVNVGLFRDEKLIELRPIGTIICDEPEVGFMDGSKPGKADIEALDFEGWNRLLDLGVVPTELVSQIPR